MPRTPLLLATPFRLFFLCAGIMATAWLPLWLLVLFHDAGVSSNLGRTMWHAHEMVFGYTAVVLAGFLLTAAGNWTKRETLRGPALGALFVVWLASRGVGLASEALPHWLPAVLDSLFWLGFAFGLGRAVIGARSWRNLPFVILVLVLGVSDLAMHLGITGQLDPEWTTGGLAVALDAITLIIFIFGGRIIPGFTSNGLSLDVRRKGWLDWIGLFSLATLLVSHALFPLARSTSIVAIVAGTINAARLYGWRGTRTFGTPLLWVLHLGWLLASLGVALTGLSGLIDAIPKTASTHLLTVGGIGILTLGMMARVALGHTGRPLVAPKTVAIGFAALIVATAVRVIGPTVWPSSYFHELWFAAVLWSLTFAVFTIRYARILLMPRADGRPG